MKRGGNGAVFVAEGFYPEDIVLAANSELKSVSILGAYNPDNFAGGVGGPDGTVIQGCVSIRGPQLSTTLKEATIDGSYRCNRDFTLPLIEVVDNTGQFQMLYVKVQNFYQIDQPAVVFNGQTLLENVSFYNMRIEDRAFGMISVAEPISPDGDPSVWRHVTVRGSNNQNREIGVRVKEGSDPSKVGLIVANSLFGNLYLGIEAHPNGSQAFLISNTFQIGMIPNVGQIIEQDNVQGPVLFSSRDPIEIVRVDPPQVNAAVRAGNSVYGIGDDQDRVFRGKAFHSGADHAGYEKNTVFLPLIINWE